VKLAAFRTDGAVRIGVVDGDELVELDVADPALPANWPGVFALGADGRARLEAAVASGRGRRALDGVELAPPIARPGKFLGVGLNYADHVEEAGMDLPATPTVFGKMATSIAGPYDPIQSPTVSEQLDYEGELGLVIGTRCKDVALADAAAMIAGFLVVDDVSVRDWQLDTSQWTVGKSFDTHGPIGPWLTTADEVADPETLGLKTWVDGDLRQDGNTAELIHKIDDMIAVLTTVFTLEPGDILSTGSPRGVGAAHVPPRYLTVGQTVRIEIEGLGAIENRVVAEPPSTTFID
jgi:2-keto-4-pentenoate hydratase/2-oxohepta-3-ene-1,7-dioic acid hydratase in catechol pathway